MVGADRRVVVIGAVAMGLVLGLSACGRKAGPYAPPPPEPGTQAEPELGPDGSRKFILDPLVQ
ncbi:lipoprotein [Amorphus coralli]|uniref:lipoprotein n=1 Tax=Amorphus coralli TaxID=340680 RepID=UPI0012EC012E|nr:lipoprotein [Amorphus coralli]